MNRSKQFVLALALGALACEAGLSGPGSPGGTYNPTFYLGPSAPPDSTGCGEGEAFALGNEVNDPVVTLTDPSNETRVQCGAVAFDEVESFGHVRLNYTFDLPGSYVMWVRKLRPIDGSPSIYDTVFADYQLAAAFDETFDVPASPAYDLVAFGLAYGASPENLNFIENHNDGVVQLWRAAAAPSNVGISASAETVTLTWTNQHWGRSVDSTEIFRWDGSAWTRIAILPPNVSQYSDPGRPAGLQRYFLRHVTGVAFLTPGDVGPYVRPNSPTTDEKSVIIGALAPPSNLTAVTVSTSQINLTWADNTTNETGFRIDTAAGGTANWGEITTVGAGVTTYANTGLAGSTTRKYRVRAYNALGNSGYSNEATATTFPPIPAAPTNLSATPVSSTKMNLAWTDNATNEAGFKIERKPAGGTFAEVASLGANATAYQDVGLTPSTWYTYRVRAFSGPSFSAYSNQATNVTNPPPSPLSVTILGPEVVLPGATCSWVAQISGGTPSYVVQWSGLGTGNEWSTTATMSGSSATVQVDVWDAVGAHVSTSVFVTTDPNAPPCNQ